MIRNTWNKSLAAVLAAAGILTSLSACSSNGQEVPVLADPPSAPEFFIKAGRSDLEYRDAICATVLPELSVVSPADPLYLRKLNYKVGDKVSKGDTVAVGLSESYTDVESLKKDLAEAKKELAFENSLYSLGRRKSSLLTGLYEKNKQTDMLKSEKDSQRISSVSHSYNVSRQQKKISELTGQLETGEKAVRDSEMKAGVSGTVFYTREFAANTYCETGECVAIIADDSHNVLYVPDINEQNWDQYELFTVIDGKEVPLKRIGISEEEKMYALSKDTALNVLFECPSDKLKAGDQIPVYKRIMIKEDCINIYSSAIFETSDEQYVYVKTPKGKEKRTVTTGKEGLGMTEIVSGLKEGEEYYYRYEGSIPASFESYKVKNKDFSVSRDGSPHNDNDETVLYTAKYDLKVVSSEASSHVFEKDPIMTVDYTPSRSSVLANEIEILQAEAYDQSAALREQLKFLRSKKYPPETDPEELKVMKEVDRIDIRMINIELERASAQNAYATWKVRRDLAENKKNKGVKEDLVSDFTGEISNNAKAGDSFKKGDILYSSVKTSVTNAYAAFDNAVSCIYNRKVRFSSKDKGDKFKGTVVGFKSSLAEGCSTFVSGVTGGKPFIYDLPALGREAVAVIRTDDGHEMVTDIEKAKYKATVKEIELDDVISVPSQCVFWELIRHSDPGSDEPDVYKPYVLVQTDGYYVKRYVEVYRSKSVDPEIWVTGNLKEGEQLLKPLDNDSYQSVNKMKDYSRIENEAVDIYG